MQQCKHKLKFNSNMLQQLYTEAQNINSIIKLRCYHHVTEINYRCNQHNIHLESSSALYHCLQFCIMY